MTGGSRGIGAAIARALEVQYVITGTVRTDRAGEGAGTVRVTPQLVRVDGEEEVWSGGFDATFAPGGLFALQSAIAESVAARLTVGLSLPERLALQARPTDDAAAYEAFLRGNVYASRAYEEATSRLAVESFREAVTRDPRFALAHARLAQAQTMYYAFRDRAPARLDTATKHIERALALDPSHEIAAFNLGVALEDLGRTDDAVRAYQRAIALDPDNADAHYNLAGIYERRGEKQAALRHLKAYRALIA